MKIALFITINIIIGCVAAKELPKTIKQPVSVPDSAKMAPLLKKINDANAALKKASQAQKSGSVDPTSSINSGIAIKQPTNSNSSTQKTKLDSNHNTKADNSGKNSRTDNPSSKNNPKTSPPAKSHKKVPPLPNLHKYKPLNTKSFLKYCKGDPDSMISTPNKVTKVDIVIASVWVILCLGIYYGITKLF